MRTETKSAVKNSVGRLIFVGLFVLIQIGWIVFAAIKLSSYSTLITLLTNVLALVIVLIIYGKEMNAAYKMPWFILILVSPIIGVCLYILLGTKTVTHRKRLKYEKIDATLFPYLHFDRAVMKELEEKDISIANQTKYIEGYAHYPLKHNTDAWFYATAEEGIAAQKAEIAKAEKFIFMEYHAIEDAESFGEVRALLKQKAAEGVEVRLFYDDIGSIGFINKSFIQKMEKDGIKCRVFNPVNPFFNMFMNHRDHRKITVIDGVTGFTGGYNLANEYFNITHPYGHWKDTGVMIKGDAVANLTQMFLEMWNAIEETDTEYLQYFPEVSYQATQHGFVQPYADSPLDEERVGESVYMNVVKNAKRYVYFITPYLIISDEMERELELAAKRGVDVRIVTPGIPDKKMVYQLTRSYYGGLVKRGVRIFEYTPGFCHAKQCVCDDEVGTVGTINLDYRSLYLHFENGVFLYDNPAVTAIKADFDQTFPLCEEVTEKYKTGRSAALRLGQRLLRLVSPLL